MTVACPRTCGADDFATPSDLAAHLIDVHCMAGLAALARARQIAGEVRSLAAAIDAEFPSKPVLPRPVLPAGSTPEEVPMQRCKNCGGDHRSDNKLCPMNGGTKDGGGGRVEA